MDMVNFNGLMGKNTNKLGKRETKRERDIRLEEWGRKRRRMARGK